MSRSVDISLSAALVAACAALAVSAAVATAHGQSRSQRALAGPNVVLEGAAAGTSVSGAGDVNGDGRADVVVGGPDVGASRRGVAYVVFGRKETERVQLEALGEGGFRIEGAAPGDALGASVAGAGDVNGDELADIVVGAPLADNNARENSGSAYVVFGKKSSEPVRLAALGEAGFRIDGARTAPASERGDGAGRSVAGAGDMNADGLADVIVGAPFSSHNGRVRSGSAYVVLGRTATTTVDLAQVGAQGFRLDGASPDDGAGEAVAGTGDVNGDGFGDVVVGAPAAGEPRPGAGAAYVVFGSTATVNADLATLGGRGFRILGAATGDFTGGSVGGAGDVNGDARPDVVIGAPYAANNRRRASGSAYVVFGGDGGTVDLASIGARGFRIDGAAVGDFAGFAVAGAGDLDGDGRHDLVVGAPRADREGVLDTGAAYVVFGQEEAHAVDLASPADRAARLTGPPPAIPLTPNGVGASVAGAGDVNEDGLADVVVGAPGSSDNGRDSGSAFVVFGTNERGSLDLARVAERGFRIEGPRTIASQPPPAPTPPGPRPPASSLTVRRFSTSPARPRAGATFSALVRVALSGSSRPVRSARVACRATISGRVVRVASRRFRAGTATCRWRLPASAGGKVVRGTVTVTSGRARARVAFTRRIARR